MLITAIQSLPQYQIDRADYTIKIRPWQAPQLMEQMWDKCSLATADFIIVPFILDFHPSFPLYSTRVMEDFVQLLPEYDRYQHKYILLDNSDTDYPYPSLQASILFKTSANYRYPEVLALPYNVNPGPEPPAIQNAPYDIAFMGDLEAHSIRKAMNKWRHCWQPYEVDFKRNEKSFWSHPPEERAKLQEVYQQQLKEAKFILCPRGRALNSRRFYEVLAHGRIPILITDAAKLPLEHLIDYAQFILYIPEGFGRWTTDYIDDFLEKKDLQEAAQLARRTFEQYLSPNKFRQFIELSLEQGIKEGHISSNEKAGFDSSSREILP